MQAAHLPVILGRKKSLHPLYLTPHVESRVEEIRRLLRVCNASVSNTARANSHEDPESSSLPTASTKRSKKGSTKKMEDIVMKDPEETPKNVPKRTTDAGGDADPSDEDGAEAPRRYDDDDDDADDPFRGGYLGGGPHASMSSTLRALSGYVSGVSQRLRDILSNLRQKDDPSVQLIALQELSEILLVSNEDNLSGHFSPDQFVKELVTLMQPSEFGEENPEMMLYACRCIANLMEALPPSAANVVYGGAVPILCQKLLEIHFIDLAEQALSVSFEITGTTMKMLT